MSGHSPVWACFRIAENDKYSVCNLCGAQLSRGRKGDNSTSPMWNHLRSRHAGRYQMLKASKQRTSTAASSGAACSTPGPSQESDAGDILEASQVSCGSSVSETSDAPSTSSMALGEQPRSCKRRPSDPSTMSVPAMFERTQAFRPGDRRSTTITRMIAEMICLDQQPLSLVENIGFRRLINHLESRYTIPSRKHIADKIIPEMYAQHKDRVAALLQTSTSVGITTDMWTSTCSDDYISLTAHFVDQGFTYHHVCLECVPFKGIAHTGAAIRDFLGETLTDWDLQEKVVCIMRDNGANMVSGLGASGFPHMPCLAHTFQLVVKDGLLGKPEIGEILQACRAIVGHFKHSAKAMKVLRTVQERIKVPQHRLIQDEPTRWNSQLNMMKRLLEQKEAILLSCAELNFQVGLSNRHWTALQDVVQLLENFNAATIRVSSSTSTISEVIPIVNSIVRTLLDFKSPRPSVLGLCELLRKSLRRRYTTMEKEEMYFIATLLDPRFKGAVFISRENLEDGKTRLLELMRVVSASGGGDRGTQRPTTPQPPPATVSGAPAGAAGGDPMLDIICKAFPSTYEEPSEDITLVEEMDAYLKEPNLPGSSDIFQYWKRNWKYPCLKVLARKYLVTPASTVYSERLFSTSGLIVDQKRSRLDPERVRMLVFLNKNLP